MDKQFSPIWQQALTGSLLSGRAFGWNKTVAFQISAPTAGTALRLRFTNRRGRAPYEIGAMTVLVNGRLYAITHKGEKSFRIPVGESLLTDRCAVELPSSAEIELRMYYTGTILDTNMIEEGATLLRGNHTEDKAPLPMKKPALAKLLGAYNGIPAMEAVEMETAAPLKAIVAFGDSITALSRWTKPLAARLHQRWPGEYALLNAGISGNCLLYEPKGVFGPVFGERGAKRFETDVLPTENLSVVIFGLGVNDVSYLTKQSSGQINLENYRNAVTEIVNTLHRRGVWVAMQTISPRLGVARTMGRYNREMETLRLELNAWIRSAGIFDYLFDAEAVVREEHSDGFYYREGLHQGDRLHPNAKGGRQLAEAFDLNALTGRED